MNLIHSRGSSTLSSQLLRDAISPRRNLAVSLYSQHGLPPPYGPLHYFKRQPHFEHEPPLHWQHGTDTNSSKQQQNDKAKGPVIASAPCRILYAGVRTFECTKAVRQSATLSMKPGAKESITYPCLSKFEGVVDNRATTVRLRGIGTG